MGVVESVGFIYEVLCRGGLCSTIPVSVLPVPFSRAPYRCISVLFFLLCMCAEIESHCSWFPFGTVHFSLVSGSEWHLLQCAACVQFGTGAVVVHTIRPYIYEIS